jgi:hypothetical protein
MDIMSLLAEAGKFLAPLIEAYGGEYGWAVAAVAYIGTFRLIFKPIHAAVKQIVKDTPSQKDDQVLEKVEGNIIFKAVIFLVDLLASIKIKSKDAAPKA